MKMCASIQLLVLFSALLWVTVNSQHTFTSTEFERMTYCKSVSDKKGGALVKTACAKLDASYTGGCRSAKVILTDQGSLTNQVSVFIGLCYVKGQKHYVKCVTDDDESTSDLLVWNYDSKSKSCDATGRILTGDGSGRQISKDSDAGNYNFGIPAVSSKGGDVAYGVPATSSSGGDQVAYGVPLDYNYNYYSTGGGW